MLNNFNDVIILRGEAVSDRYGEALLKYERSWPGKSSLSSKEIAKISEEFYKVKTIPFSSIIEELGEVDLVKIDCEGCEYNVLLNGYRNGILKHIKNVAVEVHGNLNTIVKLLAKFGFNVVTSSSFPQLVYASQTSDVFYKYKEGRKVSSIKRKIATHSIP